MVRLLATEPRGTRASWGPDPLAQSVPLVQLVLPLPTCYLQKPPAQWPKGAGEGKESAEGRAGQPLTTSNLDP